MAKALYREYRPQTFDQVLGQDRVVNVLKNQVKNNNFSHAYIFAGERGCGKTTCAKIFAKAINCLNPKDGSPCLECENCKAIGDESTIDIIEMDAASNRRIDDIRNLKDNVIYPPNKLKYKVYIIDEAHMITREAFNALLKIMEEPPSHLIFILATTEIDKIPNTILSRVQNFEFNKIDASKIEEQIDIILKDKNIKMENEAIDLIIRKAKGAMRDALSILDQVISYDKEDFTISDVEGILGVVDFYTTDKLVSSIISYSQKEALGQIFDLRKNNKSNKDILDSLTFYLRDIMIYKMTGDDSVFENAERADFIKKRAEEVEIDRLLDMLDILNDYSTRLRQTDNTDLVIELMVVRLITSKDLSSIESRLRSLEMSKEDDLISIINNVVEEKLKSFNNLKSIPKTTEEELVRNLEPSKDHLKSDDSEDLYSEKLTINEDNPEKKEDEGPSKVEDTSKENVYLAKNMVEDIKNVIIDIAGRMLKPMFEADGFHYSYSPGEFILYLKDDFYGIFVQTKTEEIGNALGEIFGQEVVFDLGDYSKMEEVNQKKTPKLEEASEKSTTELKTDDENIEDIPEVTKKEEISKEEDISYGSEVVRLKEIFGEELIIK